MKYITLIIFINLFFYSNGLSQNKNNSLPHAGGGFHDPFMSAQLEFNKNKFPASHNPNEKLDSLLKNLGINVFSPEGSIEKKSRTIVTKTLLDDNYLRVESIYQTWNGTTWVNDSRDTYLYDQMNNNVQSTYQTWNGTTWVNYSRQNNVYDQMNNLVQATYQTWNGTAWVNSGRNTLTYDSNNNYVEQIYENWNGSAWVYQYRYTYTYDTNNNLTGYLYQTWSGSAWVNGSRYTSTYDANNNRIEQLGQQWNGSAWVNSYRYTYAYDANNNNTLRLYQTWNGTAWLNVNKYTNIFDLNNNQIERVTQEWDGTAWINKYRYTYTYNTNNQLTEQVFQTWDVSAWKNSSKYTLTYNANQNVIEYLVQQWDVSAWVNSARYTITYDINENVLEELIQNWNVSAWVNSSRYLYTYDANNNQLSYTYQNWNGTTWDNQSRSLNTYTPATSITLVSPNGGESWQAGTSKNITWSISNIASIKIEYSTNNGTNWINIGNVTASAGSFSWTVPATPSANCKVKISDVSNANLFDVSDTVFTITPATNPEITVTSPNGGENWIAGSSHPITWTSVDVSNVAILYSTDNGVSWSNVVLSTPSDGSYDWTIPNTPSANCRVFIVDLSSASVNDQSNAVFTISPPPNPQVSLTSPNGGENLRVGTNHNITWTSTDIDSVKLTYSTDSGTTWSNIITSTPSDGSYSWTVPNTPSSNCKVMISNVADPSIDDTSSSVFTIFAYPSSITLNNNYSFGDPTQTNSYLMLGLPGANNLAMSSIVSGTAGANNDWRAFWDSGNGSYIEYDGSSTFNFTPGRAFWIVSKNAINVSRSVSSVNLLADNSYSIPLHNEWNLISNPFEKSVSWNSIKTINSITQPVHYYQSGSYSNPANFEPYKGYYFFNSGGLSTLKIPYSATGTGKQVAAGGNVLDIALLLNSTRKAEISIGISELAEPGIDDFDIFSPPWQFCDAGLVIYNKDIETNYKYLQTEFRPVFTDGQEFNIIIKNNLQGKTDMVFNGLDQFAKYQVYLLDKQSVKLTDLKQINRVEINGNANLKEFSVFMGTAEYIAEIKKSLLPREFALNQNYPNPFNPATTIRYQLPAESVVHLKVFDILGNEIQTLVDETKPAGIYELSWNAENLPSGIYFYRLQAGSFIETRKMILIK